MVENGTLDEPPRSQNGTTKIIKLNMRIVDSQGNLLCDPILTVDFSGISGDSVSLCAAISKALVITDKDEPRGHKLASLGKWICSYTGSSHSDMVRYLFKQGNDGYYYLRDSVFWNSGAGIRLNYYDVGITSPTPDSRFYLNNKEPVKVELRLARTFRPTNTRDY